MKYNHLFMSKFEGCVHLASYHDPHRQRDVKVFMVPGDHEHVGIYDGVDTWIAPVNTTVAGVDLIAILASVRDGTFSGAGVLKTFRRRIRVESAVPEVNRSARRMINV